MIIVVFGLPGSGKSYFARHLQKKIDASFLNTDMIREELNIKGRYGEETKQHVYDEIKKRTTYHLKMGRNVLVDGTFHKKKRRGDLSRLAEEKGIKIFFIEIKASEQTIKQRLAKNRKYSEADFAVYNKLKKEFEAASGNQLVLWSDSEPTDKMIIKAKRYIYGHQTDPCLDE